jgi:hypothetical protein
MSPPTNVRVRPAQPPAPAGRGVLCWVCTKNPFYVLSAGLFLIGLYLSFGAQTGDVETWALMSGLAGYTLLLAATACLLVRFGNVWDDVRTVLLLVVLMFLATSVTFDEVLVLNPARGLICYGAGLLFAAAVTEGILRGTRLRLPAWFRLPYYLTLVLFFAYPPALTLLLDEPRSEALTWGLFGFSPAAALVFLTLLPAVRRGPEYVRDNGSPWPWPLYPWALFGLLGFAVPARSFLLCWSMHLLSGTDRDHLIFGLYFLVPFGLAVAVLLLEAGLVSRRRGAVALALALPAGLAVLASLGHRPDAIYQGFLHTFMARLGGSPLWVTLLAAMAFYAYAGLRRVPLAVEALTAAVTALAVVGPRTLDLDTLVAPRPAPLLAAAALQLGLGVWRRDSWHCLLGATVLAPVAVWALTWPPELEALRVPAAFHLALVGALIVGAAFDDALGELLRILGMVAVLLACLTVTTRGTEGVSGAPPWAVLTYPLVMAGALAVYGALLRQRPWLVAAALALVVWMAGAGWRGYLLLRQTVAGLDHMAVGLALFVLAVLVSLGKAGALSRRRASGREAPPAERPPAPG